MLKALKKILFISNGYGEDTIAGKVIDRLKSAVGVEIHGWPMVGPGAPYAGRDLPIVGAQNLLPSCGFGTMSLKLFFQDLRAGWISTHWRQVQSARSLRGKYDLIVAVGDVVVIVAARLARAPFLFVGCAKSSYYNLLHGYTPMEKRMLRKHCLLTFPRDEFTIAELERAGVRQRYVGNPMMDGLEGTGETFGLPLEKIVIGLLPGSRTEAEDNALHLLRVAAATTETRGPQSPLQFLYAVHPQFNVASVRERAAGVPGWSVVAPLDTDAARGIDLRLRHTSGVEAWIIQRHLADVLRRASLVVGLAGTANEQAVGLGKPLITFPAAGVQGKEYVKMKMEFFGESAVAVSPEPAEVARAIADLLNDPQKQARMIAAGRERMGLPGASEAMAQEILRALEEIKP